MPLAGIRCRLTAMLMADCMPNRMARPAAAKRVKASSLRMARAQRADDDEGEQRDQRQAERDAEFLRRHREDEVGVALGQHALDRALARASAEPAAAHEAFGRDVDVEGVAGRRIEEVLDAARDVRHGEIGDGEADAGDAGDARTPRSAACRP